MATEILPFTFPSRLNEPLAIAHVTVVPMDKEQLLPDYTVIIKDGYIRVLGPASEFNLTNLRVVDGSGKYLMPGLADMHVHYWDSGEFTMYLANGVTLVRNMWGAPLHLALERKVQQGVLPGPHIVTTSPIIDGPGANGRPIHPESMLLTDPEQATALVKRYAERGYRQIKVYSYLTLEMLQALGKAATEVGLRMTGHCPTSITFEEAIAAGITCFEHLMEISNGHLKEGIELDDSRLSWPEILRLRAQYLDMAAIRRLAQQMAEQQVWNCPTQVVWQPWSTEESMLMANPLLQYELPTAVFRWQQTLAARSRDAQHSEQEWLDAARAREEMHLQVISVLHEEGAPLLLGTDTVNPHVYQGFAVHQELVNLVQAGLSPYEALKCGTSEAARFMGESALWGTISVGKRADLLLVRTNPLLDVAAAQDLEAVFVNGFYLTRSDLDSLLAQRAASVQNIQALFPTELDSSEQEEGLLIQQGTWHEEVSGMKGDQLSYRHYQFEDESYLVEERYATVKRAGAHRCMTLRTIRLWLEANGELRRGEEYTESLAGEEQCIIERSDQGSFEVQRTEMDGYESHTVLETPVLVPSERLSLTAMPLLIGAQAKAASEQTLPALSIDADDVHIVPLNISYLPEENSPLAESINQWKLAIERPGATTVQSYQLTADGSLLRMQSSSSIWTPDKSDS